MQESTTWRDLPPKGKASSLPVAAASRPASTEMATGTRAHSTGACSSAAYSGFGDGTYSSALSEDSDDAASENGSAPALSESSAVSSAMSHSLAASEEGDLPWASPATSARAAAPKTDHGYNCQAA